MTRIRLFTAVCLFIIFPSYLAAATKTWLRTGTNRNWSFGGNWTDGTPPVTGDDLVFLSSPPGLSDINDLPAGFEIHTLTFSTDHTVIGNAIAIGGGISSSAAANLSMPITLTASQTWDCSGSGSIYTGLPFVAVPLDLGTNTLTIQCKNALMPSQIKGAGAVVVTGDATMYGQNSYTGTTTVAHSAAANCNGCTIAGPVNVSGFFLIGYGSSGFAVHIGALTATGGVIDVLIPATSGSLTLDAASRFNSTLDPWMGFPTLSVTGTVTLGNARLAQCCYAAAPGVYTLIDNDGTDPVSGTFAGLPEGALIVPNLQISYRGGTGNDVTITVLGPSVTTATTLAATPNPAHALEAVALTATVTASSGTPSGNVFYFDQESLLGSAPLVAGIATMTTSSLAPGAHNLTATFVPTTNGVYGSTSAVVVETVTALPTSTALSARPRPTVLGAKTTLTASVTSAAGTPSGTVTFYDDTTALATQPIAGGTAAAVVGPLARGLHSLTARFTPDTATYVASTSPPVGLEVEVAELATTTTLAVTPESSTRGQAVTLTAQVMSAGGSVLGSVIFADGDNVLDTQPLITQTVSITTSALSVGSHTLTATFIPLTSLYGPSTAPAVVHVVAEAPARRRVAAH